MHRVLIQQLHGLEVDVLDVLNVLVGLGHHVGGEDGGSIMAPLPEHSGSDAELERRRRGRCVHVQVQGRQRRVLPAVAAGLHLGFPLVLPREQFWFSTSLRSSSSRNLTRHLQEKQFKNFSLSR